MMIDTAVVAAGPGEVESAVADPADEQRWRVAVRRPDGRRIAVTLDGRLCTAVVEPPLHARRAA